MKPEIVPIESLKNALAAHKEWLLNIYPGKTFSLQNHEIEIEELGNRILLSFISDKGFETWRIVILQYYNERFALDLSRNFGAEQKKIELIPRIKAQELSGALELARLEKANKLGALLNESIKDAKLIRIELNKENGRTAQIIFQSKLGEKTAVLSDVSESLSPEILLSSAIIWLSKLQRRKKEPIDRIWVLAESKKVKNLQKLHACLKDTWKLCIAVKEISGGKSKKQKNKKEAEKPKIKNCKSLRIRDLWRFNPPKLRAAKKLSLSKTAREIVKLYPEKIDHLFSNQGETLRFLGLPFFRVRKTPDEERAWFGAESRRRILDESSLEELEKLLADLNKYRHFSSPNKQHFFYQAAPESWLESILRQNIKLLDANLILSPIYNQFRASRDKIDLLALRKDGRLVIIELKVSSDREMIFQAVDYWRKIELQRRAALLNKAKLFGKREIADKSTIIYLVAPKLSF